MTSVASGWRRPLLVLACLGLLIGCSTSTGHGEAFIEKYGSGQKQVEGYRLDDGTPDGRWTAWHRNGQKATEGVFKNGSAEGRWIAWHANGQKRMDGALKDGEEEGRWTYWNKDGSLEHERSGIYKAGVKIAPLPEK